MDRKKKILVVIAGIFAFVCVITAVVLVHVAGIYAPSDGKILYEIKGTGIAQEDTLSEEEIVKMKTILWRKIRWPESLYGYPACGFNREFAIILDGTRYVLAWDGCGVICVEGTGINAGRSFYISITKAEREIIADMFHARGTWVGV